MLLDASKVLIYKGFFMPESLKNLDFTRFLVPLFACNLLKTLILYTVYDNKNKGKHYE
jgi:hypothetical protein